MNPATQIAIVWLCLSVPAFLIMIHHELSAIRRALENRK